MKLLIADTWCLPDPSVAEKNELTIDDVLVDGLCEIMIDGGVDAVGWGRITREEAQKIVEHLTRVFLLEKKD